MNQWEIASSTLYKNWGQVHNGAIYAMAVSLDNAYVITTDYFGNMKQWNITLQKLEKDYGKVCSEEIKAIAISLDSHFVFVTDNGGFLKQFSIRDHVLVHDYGQVHKHGITDIICTNEYIYTTDDKGHMKQYYFHTGKNVNDNNCSISSESSNDDEDDNKNQIQAKYNKSNADDIHIPFAEQTDSRYMSAYKNDLTNKQPEDNLNKSPGSRKRSSEIGKMSLPLPHISPRGRRHTIGHNNLKENCNDVHNPELITLRLRTDNIDKASIENKELLEKFESKIDNVEKRLMHTETRMEDINNKLEMLLNIVKNIFVNKPNGTPSYNQPRFDRGCSLENEDIIKITSAEANVFKFGDVDFVESADDFKNFSMKKASGKTVEGNISNISGLEFVESVDANKKDDMEGDVTP